MSADNYDYVTGPHGSIDKGYAVRFPDIDPKDNAPTGHLEAIIRGRHQSIYFWATDITASFSIGGNFGQTVDMRYWYPHNFQAATFIVSGIMPNQFQYNRLATFVRETHIALTQATISQTRLTLNAAGFDPPTDNVSEDQQTEQAPWHGGMKGSRTYYDLTGYVQNIQKGAERFVFAPTFSFGFIVDQIGSQLYNTNTVSVSDTLAWMQSSPISPNTGKDFVQNPSVIVKAKPPQNRHKRRGR